VDGTAARADVALYDNGTTVLPSVDSPVRKVAGVELYWSTEYGRMAQWRFFVFQQRRAEYSRLRLGNVSLLDISKPICVCKMPERQIKCSYRSKCVCDVV
jgi:hypothetical protein